MDYKILNKEVRLLYCVEKGWCVACYTYVRLSVRSGAKLVFLIVICKNNVHTWIALNTL